MPRLRENPRHEPSPEGWFATAAGRAVLMSEAWLLDDAARERAAHGGWACASVTPQPNGPDAERLGPMDWRQLRADAPALRRPARPFGLLVLQHVTDALPRGGRDDLLAQAAQAVAPGGELWVLALNPLSPYRRHWLGQCLRGCEPFAWRRSLRRHGFAPAAVAEGIGPRWQPICATQLQTGAGARAAYRIRAVREEFAMRPLHLTPLRSPALEGALPA